MRPTNFLVQDQVLTNYQILGPNMSVLFSKLSVLLATVCLKNRISNFSYGSIKITTFLMLIHAQTVEGKWTRAKRNTLGELKHYSQVTPMNLYGEMNTRNTH